jgi:thiol-disulfide isomerase/thioredoxin
LFTACSSSTQQQAPAPEHGTMSSLTTSGSLELCEHKVPGEMCVRCHPELAGKFKEVKDWCVEHDVPESQCLICHPDLSFEPLPVLPDSADLQRISVAGEDVPALDAHAAPGKITIFDFYADWCAPCRKVDIHVFTLMQQRRDIALRKLNIVDWDTPVAKRYLTQVSSLPYVVVFGKDGKQTKAIGGFDLDALDQAINDASK